MTARTDPGWVPLYPLCSGLAIERGRSEFNMCVGMHMPGSGLVIGQWVWHRYLYKEVEVSISKAKSCPRNPSLDMPIDFTSLSTCDSIWEN